MQSPEANGSIDRAPRHFLPALLSSLHRVDQFSCHLRASFHCCLIPTTKKHVKPLD
jgi:hypothetical protein